MNPVASMGGIKDINFRPERDIPTLTDKVILVTGGEDLKCYSGRDFSR